MYRTNTRAEQIRQAKAQELEQRKQAAEAKRKLDPYGRRTKVVTPEPKKVDFKRPTVTKAMMARIKQAEKFKQEYERKREAVLSNDRVPRRTPAPIGGDARVGREGRVRGKARSSSVTPAASPPRASPVTRRELQTAPSQPVPAKKDVTKASRTTQQASRTTQQASRTTQQASLRKTNELAKMMNADVVQAEPIGDGPIRNVVIPPGTVSDNRTTIVSIPQPVAEVETKQTSQVANRSIQVIRETLDEQDAAEAAAVKTKLEDLQLARRDFVIAVANVGGNAVNIADETSVDLLGLSPPRPVQRVPDMQADFFQADYPGVRAARDFLEEKETARRLEEEFERIAASEQMPEELQLNIPFEEELFQDKDISWEEDEEIGTPMPRMSRSKVQTPPPSPLSPPPQQTSYHQKTFDPEELERFFDLKRYPPIHCPLCGPPPGRENLHPDLWELDDPWYKAPPQPDMPDLIEFDLIDFD